MGKPERGYLVEWRLAPLDLTDTEIIDFLNENAWQISYNRSRHDRNASYTVFCDYGIEATAPTLRIASRTAAAMQVEANLS